MVRTSVRAEPGEIGRQLHYDSLSWVCFDLSGRRKPRVLRVANQVGENVEVGKLLVDRIPVLPDYLSLWSGILAPASPRAGVCIPDGPGGFEAVLARGSVGPGAARFRDLHP